MQILSADEFNSMISSSAAKASGLAAFELSRPAF